MWDVISMSSSQGNNSEEKQINYEVLQTRCWFTGFVSKLLLPVKYDMIDSWKIFYVKYKVKASKHPWVHEQEFSSYR